jgi:hypothetical protein
VLVALDAQAGDGEPARPDEPDRILAFAAALIVRTGGTR